MKIYTSSAETGLTSKKRLSIAKKSTDPKELSRLAYDNSSLVRMAVLQNPNTPHDVSDRLERELAYDKIGRVREAVAWHTHDLDILAKLADDENWYVRKAVAGSTNNPEILAKLADDADWHVREEVAGRTNDPNILAKLADDENADVRRIVRKRSKLARTSSTKSRKYPQSDWSIPLYSINNYSEIEGEITKVISDAANEFARKYMGESAQVEVAPGAYDSSTGVVKIHVGDNTYTIDVEDILPPATAKQKKRDCVKSLVAWMQHNLPAATDETLTMM